MLSYGIEIFTHLKLCLAPFSTITMQPRENPFRVLLGLHGNSTEVFFLKSLYRLEHTWYACGIFLYVTVWKRTFCSKSAYMYMY